MPIPIVIERLEAILMTFNKVCSLKKEEECIHSRGFTLLLSGLSPMHSRALLLSGTETDHAPGRLLNSIISSLFNESMLVDT